MNPVTTLLVAYQGQFDAIPLFLMVAACYLFELYQDTRWGMGLSSLVLGLGILNKSWPVILLPILLLRLSSWKSRFKYILGAVAIPVIGTLFYELIFPGSLPSILRRSIHAGASAGWWGYSVVLNVIVELTRYGAGLYALSTKCGKAAALLCAAITILLTRQRSTLYSLMLTVLALFATYPGVGVQYLSWLLPLVVALKMSNQVGWYIVGTTVYTVVAHWGLNLTGGLYSLMPVESAHAIVQILSLPAWLVVVLWYFQELVNKELLPCIFPRSCTE